MSKRTRLADDLRVVHIQRGDVAGRSGLHKEHGLF